MDRVGRNKKSGHSSSTLIETLFFLPPLFDLPPSLFDYPLLLCTFYGWFSNPNLNFMLVLNFDSLDKILLG